MELFALDLGHSGVGGFLATIDFALFDASYASHFDAYHQLGLEPISPPPLAQPNLDAAPTSGAATLLSSQVALAAAHRVGVQAGRDHVESKIPSPEWVFRGPRDLTSEEIETLIGQGFAERFELWTWLAGSEDVVVISNYQGDRGLHLVYRREGNAYRPKAFADKSREYSPEVLADLHVLDRTRIAAAEREAVGWEIALHTLPGGSFVDDVANGNVTAASWGWLLFDFVTEFVPFGKVGKLLGSGFRALRAGRLLGSLGGRLAGRGDEAIRAVTALRHSDDALGTTGKQIGSIADDIVPARTSRLASDINLPILNQMDSCFAGGTPILTPAGPRAIEDLQPGDTVLSRPEDQPGGPLTHRPVERVFRLEGLLVHLCVGAYLVRTTAEHPFFVPGRGWVPARCLDPGDCILGHDGHATRVDEVRLTEDLAPVYNLRVAEDHTYFVGGESWGFSLWAHNTYEVRWKGNVLGYVDGKGNWHKFTDEQARQLGNHLRSDDLREGLARALVDGWNRNANKTMRVGGAGHHVPAVRKAKGRPFEVSRSDLSHPTIHVIGDEGTVGRAHWRMHNAERTHIGPRQGDFEGTDAELFEAYRKSYRDLIDIRVDVRSPDGSIDLGRDVSLVRAVNLLEAFLTGRRR